MARNLRAIFSSFPTWIGNLYQIDAGFAAAGDHFLGPDAALDFADVGFAQEEHAEAALADAAADGAGEFSGEQALVEGEVRLPLLTLDFQLAAQGLLVHADAHAGQFERPLEDVVPDQDVAVEALESLFVGAAPVVVVGGAAVMRLPVRQDPADADDEDGSPAAHNLFLPLFGIQPRIELHQFLGVDEMDIFRKFRRDLREFDEQFILRDLDVPNNFS